MMGQYDAVKQQVIDISRSMVEKGFLIGIGGNVSVRVPGENRMAITPSGYDYMKMVLDDVCIVDWGIALIEGTMKPSIESGMHAAIYENRADVNVVIHTHQVSASAVALTNRAIPSLFDEQVRFLGRSVDMVDYGLSGTTWLKNNIVRKLKNNCNAYIMKNHGALTLGSNPERAMLNVELLEKCAGAFLLAYYTGERLTQIPMPVREILFSKLRKDQKQGTVTNEHGK
jgi:L-ribulose-5-phosphate 4-epimerase